MNLLLFCLALLLAQDEIPFKANEDFEVKLNFEFKERTRPDPSRVELGQTAKEYERSHASGPLPYLYLNLRVLKQYPEEIRMRVVKNGEKIVLNKKFDLSTVVKLDLGFTDDIKDRVSAYEYTILFLKENKQPVSKVVVYFHEDGTYLVNGQVRGKL
ncbi:MAG: hypothetical protein WKF87_13355 [Chryseolinea sp.]